MEALFGSGGSGISSVCSISMHSND